MARYSNGMASTIVGTATLPVYGLLSTASVTPILRAVKVTNTTATACVYKLVNLTGGTPGASQPERRHRRNAPAAACDPRAGWTVAATIGEDLGYRFNLGAAVGAGEIETFGAEGLEGELGATAAIGLLIVSGSPSTGPEVSFVWDE
jgi:hypothetical protein